MQDLEVQNIELVEANEKLQKELGMLRGLAKEAILEKKKSQAALEALKHQVVHLLGKHTRGAQQGAPKQDPAAQPSTGWLPVSFWTRSVLACVSLYVWDNTPQCIAFKSLFPWSCSLQYFQ